jgi:hypothetical protein
MTTETNSQLEKGEYSSQGKIHLRTGKKIKILVLVRQRENINPEKEHQGSNPSEVSDGVRSHRKKVIGQNKKRSLEHNHDFKVEEPWSVWRS